MTIHGYKPVQHFTGNISTMKKNMLYWNNLFVTIDTATLTISKCLHMFFFLHNVTTATEFKPTVIVCYYCIHSHFKMIRSNTFSFYKSCFVYSDYTHNTVYFKFSVKTFHYIIYSSNVQCFGPSTWYTRNWNLNCKLTDTAINYRKIVQPPIRPWIRIKNHKEFQNIIYVDLRHFNYKYKIH